MNCKRFEQQIWAYLEGQLPSAQAQAFEAHLQGVPRCQRQIAAAQATYRALRALPRHRAPENLVAQVRHRMAQPSARPRVDWARVWRRVALAPALGLLTIAVWWGWQAQQPNTPCQHCRRRPDRVAGRAARAVRGSGLVAVADAELLHQHRVHPMRAAFLLASLVWTLGWAQERPVQWLQRAQQAEETLAVAGARVVEITAGRTVQRIEERFWRQGARAERIEVLAPLNGAARCCSIAADAGSPCAPTRKRRSRCPACRFKAR
jgi:anti-sigma factor RsiW